VGISPTKSERNAISDVEDFGMKVCMSYLSILPSRRLTKIIKKFRGDFVA